MSMDRKCTGKVIDRKGLPTGTHVTDPRRDVDQKGC